ncbi:oligosaccharide flippase family protein [Mariniphaga sp.]|uniref:oligosaccharide flippase family protein n=1 Tax=Mariniphaga sp. TaxID=1954475 RepID=UPI003565E4BB
MSNSENNKRIAKNTILLYFRMFLTMGVSLYTSRIVLNTLGVEDFGIYNVVGGVVTMFSFLNHSMALATQRFLSFELGKKNFEQLKKVFSMSVNIHAIIAVASFILAETIGLWFLNTKLNIPAERMSAANWVYQFSIFSFMITVMRVPYNATIIAHERMSVYAWVSIVEVILKLIIVFALVWLGFDKLKLYAVLIFSVSALVWFLYKIYCKRNFTETNYQFLWEKSLYKTLINYAGWNLFGNLAVVAFNQGINIMLNIFFGPAINAARGIAYQVNGAVSSFFHNFQMSMNPQIVKSYAADDHQYMQQLIFRGSKYSFFLLYFLSLPILLQTETILKWWLKLVPEYTVLFCQLILADALINCISGTLNTAVHATGKIKKYQAVVGGILLCNVPLSYIFLKLGYPPQVTLLITISLSVTAFFARLSIIIRLLNFSASDFLRQVVLKVLMVTALSCIIPLAVLLFVTEEGLIRFLIVCSLSFFSTIMMVYSIGLNNQERKFVNIKVSQFITRIISFNNCII